MVSAEIPDQGNDKELFNSVVKHMIHGPCGQLNHKSLCMVENRCSKGFPKAFEKETITGEDGYPLYRRRDPDNGGQKVTIGKGKQETVVDNSWVVPYSPLLIKTFDCHINVEFCNSIKSIKYVTKYVNKGTDACAFSIEHVLFSI